MTMICCVLLLAQACQEGGSRNSVIDSLAVRRRIPPSPVLDPLEAIQKMKVENGFAVRLVAAEPLVVAPVALNFDEQGRIWVVEMEEYMNDTLGTGEEVGGGKIVVLSDKDGDGVMDNRQAFLDSLVLPRAICLIGKGILVAEPPRLWYYEIQNDRPVRKTLVDSAYAEGGNVEHQPNGLFRAMDNWIYSAKSAKRYRLNGKKWLIEKTHFRGQWGITQDDQGRLLYNTNSDNLLGDYFSPGLGQSNDHMRSVAGYDENIIPDNRVYPIRPTPGVNRGYMKGVLDDSLRLVNFTAACGSLFFNNYSFDSSHYGNVFVAEPSANLVKRNILSENGYVLSGSQAYHGKEFLASSDERFRPVNLYTAGDGALYIVDMYRGIIQHKTYLTPYLRNEIRERSLTRPLSCGRIYKVVPADRPTRPFQFPADAKNFPVLLYNPNGWIRNMAQQHIVDQKNMGAVPVLREILKDSTHVLAAIQSMWTLEGLGALTVNDILPFFTRRDARFRQQAISVMPSIINKENYSLCWQELEMLLDRNDTITSPYIGFIANVFLPFDRSIGTKILNTLATKYPDNVYVADALISNLKNRENLFYAKFTDTHQDTSLILSSRLRKVMADMATEQNSAGIKNAAADFPMGAALFHSVCQTCHGLDGNGVNGVAPPLNNSNWVQGNRDKLISIVLYGLSGPVEVTGKVYKAPEITGEMPGIGSNTEISDEQISQVLSFIRKSWSNKADTVSAQEVRMVRDRYPERSKPFTATELNQ